MHIIKHSLIPVSFCGKRIGQPAGPNSSSWLRLVWRKYIWSLVASACASKGQEKKEKKMSNKAEATANWDGFIECQDNEVLAELTRAYKKLAAAKFSGDCLVGDVELWKGRQPGGIPPNPKPSWYAYAKEMQIRLSEAYLALNRFGDAIYTEIAPLLRAMDAAMQLVEKREERIAEHSSDFESWLRTSQGFRRMGDWGPRWGDKDEFVHEFPNWSSAEIAKSNIKASRKLIVEALETHEKVLATRKEFSANDSQVLTEASREALSWAKRFPKGFPAEYNKMADVLVECILKAEKASGPFKVSVLDRMKSGGGYNPEAVNKFAEEIMQLLKSEGVWKVEYDAENYVLTVTLVNA